MKYSKFILISILVSSCGGGGGGGGGGTDNTGGGAGGGGGGGGSNPPSFSITIGTNSFTVDEDNQLSGSLEATASTQATLIFKVTSTSSDGALALLSSGEFTYTPAVDFEGQDSFGFEVSAQGDALVETGTANITINPINDAPVIIIQNKDELTEDNLQFEENPSVTINFGDVDNTSDELTFSAKVNNVNVSSTFTSTSDTSGTLNLDLSSFTDAGLYTAELTVSDGELSGSDIYTTWIISNKSIVTIEQDVDPEDGFSGGEKVSKDYYVYYLVGSPSSKGRTKYLFIGDSLDGNSDIGLYRRALIASINKLNDSDAAEFFTDDYFTVVSAEPVNPDGTSPVGVRTGCYDYDESIYCIADMDTAIFDDLLPGNVLVSTLTRVQGRGVNLGNRNIQRVTNTNPELTRHTLMHELGHAHGYMGDEYRTDERDLTDYGGNVNTTTNSNLTTLKWRHQIADTQNVLGRDVQVCYNNANGSIQDRDNQGITVSDCDCLVNEWDTQGNFIRKNPECNGVGLFEGNYYGETDNFRPNFCNVMDSCNSAGYGAVNVEGFAVASIQNQGFYEDSSRGFIRDEETNNITGWNIELDVEYNTSKITLKWFVNGVEDTSKENQTSVQFTRPADNSVQIYTAKAIDLTRTITAPDDVSNNTDFYDGLFQSYFIWCREYSNSECSGGFTYDPNPSTYDQLSYGYMDGPLGPTWAINWGQW